MPSGWSTFPGITATHSIACWWPKPSSSAASLVTADRELDAYEVETVW